jgi:hypothetical protein
LAAVFVLLLTPTARSGTRQIPPRSFIEGALCVHSGFHYTSHRPKPSSRPDYVLWRHGYWRTWKTSGNGEGSWGAHNYGYGGGLQMDAQFQANYGSEFLARYGPAGLWPVHVQILVAYRGWLRQGWGAWPNTSTACGLR